AATILSDCLRLEFGNPLGTGFFMWGFHKESGWDNLWGPPAALYNVDSDDWSKWTITPAGKKWQDLLGIQDWDGNPSNGWTTQLTTNLDADGTINFNGFYGDYQLTIGDQIYNLKHVKGTSRYTIAPALRPGLLRVPVPEPSTLALLLMAGLFAVQHRRRK